MKFVTCINNSDGFWPLIVGKYYEILDCPKNNSDDGRTYWIRDEEDKI